MWGKTKKLSNPDNTSNQNYSLTKTVDELKIQVAHLQISQWYNQYLDRYPLPEETLNWNKELLNNVSLEIIHDKIINSMEAIKKQKKTPNSIISKTTLDEHTIFLNPNDKVCIETYADVDSYDPGSTTILKKLLKKDMNVINIGANIGYFTLLAAREVGPQGKVFAFEPFPKTVELLQKNVDVNGYSNVDVVPMAVSDKTGTAKLSVGGSSLHNVISSRIITEMSLITVPQTSVDDFMSQKELSIDFIIMDAEGSEPFILNGMAKTIEKNPDMVIMIEYNPFTLELAGSTIENFMNIIANYGFIMYLIDEVTLKITPITTEKLKQDIKYPNVANLLLSKDSLVNI